MKKKKIGNIKIHAKKKIAIIKKKKMLSLLLIIPLIGSLFIMPIQEDSELNKLKMNTLCQPGFAALLMQAGTMHDQTPHT